MAGTAVWTGIFFVLVGMAPSQFVAGLIDEPPGFVHSWLFGPSLVVVGLAIIVTALWFNLWSRRQLCIDEISEQLAWAIHSLLNKPPNANDPGDLARWWGEVIGWEAKIDRALENRAYFTRSDQLHFSVLGFVEPVKMSQSKDLDAMLAQLKMKFERLRDIVNWTQMRRR
jgi:hypothetical protein